MQVTCEAVKKAAVLTPPLKQLTLSEPKLAHQFVKAFAPATVANLGPGFDFLGCAVDGLGDYVTAEVLMYVCFSASIPAISSGFSGISCFAEVAHVSLVFLSWLFRLCGYNSKA